MKTLVLKAVTIICVGGMIAVASIRSGQVYGDDRCKREWKNMDKTDSRNLSVQKAGEEATGDFSIWTIQHPFKSIAY